MVALILKFLAFFVIITCLGLRFLPKTTWVTLLVIVLVSAPMLILILFKVLTPMAPGPGGGGVGIIILMAIGLTILWTTISVLLYATYPWRGKNN